MWGKKGDGKRNIGKDLAIYIDIGLDIWSSNMAKGISSNVWILNGGFHHSFTIILNK